MDPPEISVVVATRNRPQSVKTLLQSLARQSLDRSRFEVVIVDDCSQPPLESTDPDVKLLRHESARGPAAARNTGWRAATAPLIAFTDDDCVASEGWLEAYVAAANGASDTIVQGRTEPIDPARVVPLSKTMEVRGPTGLFETCNVSYPRALLERVGGFDETFRHACGEDAELGWRAVGRGARTDFAEDALVYHEVSQPSLRRAVAGTWKWTDGVRVLRSYPHLRVMLVRGVFWKPTHPRFLLALLGLGVAAKTRRPAIALLAAGPYAAHYVRLYERAPMLALRAIGAHVVIDACEVATMVAGSVRYRTLML